jgi:hypothetical protein
MKLEQTLLFDALFSRFEMCMCFRKYTRMAYKMDLAGLNLARAVDVCRSLELV